MPNKKWLPSFDDLDCVKPCTDRLGDSFCDCENNNEHCRYDGGDCCGSDVTFMKEPRCSCIDPVVLARLKLNDKFEGSGSGDDVIQDDSERDQGESWSGSSTEHHEWLSSVTSQNINRVSSENDRF